MMKKNGKETSEIKSNLPTEAQTEYDKLVKQYRAETDPAKKEQLRQQCIAALEAKRQK